MSVLTAVVLGLAMGVLFGIALEKSRVFEPAVIVGQMRLRNFTMLKIFLTAVITGLLVLAVLHGTGLTRLHPKATLWVADLIGGLLLGAGLAIAGACPGTVFAQIGAGYRDARLTLAGGVLGAYAFILTEPALRPLIKATDAGKLTLDGVLGIPFWIAALVFAGVLLSGVIALEKWRAWSSDLGPDADGATPCVLGTAARARVSTATAHAH